jgi:hypothetical protein
VSKAQTAGVSISFGGLLTIVFVAAKLWGKIDWSWWWVCSPIWAPPAAVLSVCATIAIVAGLVWCIASVVQLLASALRGRRDNKL